jgi:hypothetical protein
MLAKVVKFRAIDRRDRLSAAFMRTFSNTQTNRRLAGFAAKTCQDALACRWRIGPAGRLECHWEIAKIDAEANEPEPRWPINRMQSLQTILLFEKELVAAPML